MPTVPNVRKHPSRVSVLSLHRSVLIVAMSSVMSNEGLNVMRNTGRTALGQRIGARGGRAGLKRGLLLGNF